MCIEYISAGTTCRSCRGGLMYNDDELVWCDQAKDLGVACKEEEWHVEVRNKCDDCNADNLLASDGLFTNLSLSSKPSHTSHPSANKAKSTASKVSDQLANSLKQLTLTSGKNGIGKIQKALSVKPIKQAVNRVISQSMPTDARDGRSTRNAHVVGRNRMKVLEMAFRDVDLEDKEDEEDDDLVFVGRKSL